MKCPHCLVVFADEWGVQQIGKDADGSWLLYQTNCSNCERWILGLSPKFMNWKDTEPGKLSAGQIQTLQMIRPKGAARPCPTEVPARLAGEFAEACIVQPDSAKASAALSRRCLQHLLRDHAGALKRDLNDQIQEVLDSGKLPSHLAEAIDAIRNIGNFAAHPLKSTNTGEILDVEPGEAEWNLETLEGLFDFYFVQPAKMKARRAALDKKLAEAGKPPMK